MNEKGRSHVMLGVVFICLGILFLLESLNIIPVINWSMIWRMWPLLFIFIGLNIILKETKLWWIVPLLIIVLFVFMLVGGRPFSGHSYNYSGQQRNYQGSGDYRTNQDINKNYSSFDVEINIPVGKLKMGSADDEEDLYNIYLDFIRSKPEVDFSTTSGGKAQLNVKQNAKFSFFENNTNNLELYLTKRIPLSMDIKSGAGKIDLDLKNLKIKNLRIATGAGDVEIVLGRDAEKLEFDSGVSNLKLSLPQDVGLQIKPRGIIKNNNFNRIGLIYDDDRDVYRNRGYEEWDKKIDIEINSPITNVDLSLY